MKPFFIFSFLILIVLSVYTQEVTIVPQPSSVEVSKNDFFQAQKIKYASGGQHEALIRNFYAQLKELGILLPNSEKADEKSANLVLKIKKQNQAESKESYQLRVTPKQIHITASDESGLFYGLQTVAHLVAANVVTNGIKIPCLTIRDNPYFGWRGLMLDESRHFFGKEKVKQLIDWMAFYKLNRFHWHLTDEPGWRIEIKKYPLLTSVGGKGNFHDKTAEARFYTQEDIREIVRYAADRFIEIIPEIDMPGHAAAANRSYPEYSGGGSERYPDFTFNPGKDATYGFLTNILREVAALFPSKYIHLGGDEVHFGNQQWNTNADVKALMQKHQLKDLQAVEFYFINRMTDSVASLGKTMIGWDEIVTARIPNSKSKVMWWRHDKPEQLQLALQGGYRTILCPRIPLYFDFVQHDSHRSGRYWQKDFASLKKVLDFKNIYSEPLKKYPDLIEGIQANIWTETIHSPERLDFMTYPRIAALGEAAWSKIYSPDYPEFLKRLMPSLKLYRDKGISYFDPENPERTPEIQGVKK